MKSILITYGASISFVASITMCVYLASASDLSDLLMYLLAAVVNMASGITLLKLK